MAFNNSILISLFEKEKKALLERKPPRFQFKIDNINKCLIFFKNKKYVNGNCDVFINIVKEVKSKRHLIDDKLLNNLIDKYKLNISIKSNKGYLLKSDSSDSDDSINSDDSSDSNNYDDTIYKNKDILENHIIEKTYKVNELNILIKETLKYKYNTSLKLQGEISNISFHNGNAYLYIKDSESKIKCIIWKNTLVKLKERPKNGDKVVIIGKIDLYIKSGEYQIIGNSISNIGIGNDFNLFEKNKQILFEKGYFDSKNKKHIPKYIKSLGIVSSKQAAGFRDCLYKIRSLNKYLDVYISPTSVQGKDCPKEIINAISKLQDKPIDVIIICRGGGSSEDLISFNDLGIIEAIRNSKIPIVTGIGHEKDISLSDLVADYKSITPTAAAEKVTPNSNDLIKKLKDYKIFITNNIKFKFLKYYHNLQSYMELIGKKTKEDLRSKLKQYKFILYQQINDKCNKFTFDNNNLINCIYKKEKDINKILKDYKETIYNNLKNKIEDFYSKIVYWFKITTSLDPLNILNTGYVYLEHNGKVINNINQLRLLENKKIKIYLANGEEKLIYIK